MFLQEVDNEQGQISLSELKTFLLKKLYAGVYHILVVQNTSVLEDFFQGHSLT